MRVWRAIRMSNDTGILTLFGIVEAFRPSPFNMCSYRAKLSSHLRESRISLGGDAHVAGHDLCPLCQGASHLCDGSRCPGATPRCTTLGRPVCPYCRATIYPRVTVFLAGTVLGVSTTALYNKLDRVETGVAAVLVRDSAALVEPVVKALRASHPRWSVFRKGARRADVRSSWWWNPSYVQWTL
jgi:hypothetical protein